MLANNFSCRDSIAQTLLYNKFISIQEVRLYWPPSLEKDQIDSKACPIGDEKMDSSDETLTNIYSEALKAMRDAELLPRGDDRQSLYMKSRSLFERASQIVESLELFSDNEILDDIATANLKYLLIPAYLAKILISSECGPNRLETFERAEVFIKKFFQDINNYGLGNSGTNNALESNSSSFSISGPASLEAASQARSEKIEKFKKMQELEGKLEELERRMKVGDDVDDEVTREFYINLIKKWIEDMMECQQQPDFSPQASEDNLDDDCPDETRIVRHIMVIGFHHKHGYQVDYCYPPLTPKGPVFSTSTSIITLPPSWKTLPLLCLPDGSHNYDSDTIYFTMPDSTVNPHPNETDAPSSGSGGSNPSASESNKSTTTNSEGIKTIFGTACYRQIQVNKLRNRTDDMTRLSVQKSVCVLSTQPLFGLIRSKLEMITHAYFEELDFSKVRILRLTYDNLNNLLARESVRDNAIYLGLSARHLVSYFGCNMLVLFKAMLLEKKILFYKSPVRDLSSTIMSMCSLFPGLLECNGLDYSACDLQLSPQMLEALKLSPTYEENNDCSDREETKSGARVFFNHSKEEVVLENLNSTSNENNPSKDSMSPNNPINEHGDMKESQPASSSSGVHLISTDSSDRMGDFEVINRSDEFNEILKVTNDESNFEMPIEGTIVNDPIVHKLCQSKPEECGLPLQIFTRGSFCLPYLSISYLDLLSDTRVRSFVIGATNFLFKHRREMYDVIVDMDENSIMINDPNLKRCLSLTIEDLRFMDYLKRHVKLEGIPHPRDDFDLINHDITKWIGGDEWIRYHFKIYTLYLLKAAKSQTNSEAFNSHFIQGWKQTSNNYRIWDLTAKKHSFDKLQARHPFSSSVKGINFKDMKLKLNYAVNSSDKSKIVNQTLNEIGKWSIWNNLASAGNIAATSVSALANSAAAQTNLIVAGTTAATTTTNNDDDKDKQVGDDTSGTIV